MSDNLPVIVRRVGGELAKVVADIDNYTSAEHPLDRKGQMALARMIEDRPELNTEARIALLVDALTWHGLEQRTAFMTLVDAYDVETVYLALDYLFEEGERDHDTDRDARKNPEEAKLLTPMQRVTRVVEAITRLRESGVEISDVERLSDCFYRHGGFNIDKNKFNNELILDEVPEEVDEDTDRDAAEAYSH